MDPTVKLSLFLSGFVFVPYYTDTTTIDENNPESEFVETLKASLQDYKEFIDANVPVGVRSAEIQAVYEAGDTVIAKCDAYADLPDLQTSINGLLGAAQAYIS